MLGGPHGHVGAHRDSQPLGGRNHLVASICFWDISLMWKALRKARDPGEMSQKHIDATILSQKKIKKNTTFGDDK